VIEYILGFLSWPAIGLLTAAVVYFFFGPFLFDREEEKSLSYLGLVVIVGAGPIGLVAALSIIGYAWFEFRRELKSDPTIADSKLTVLVKYKMSEKEWRKRRREARSFKAFREYIKRDF